MTARKRARRRSREESERDDLFLSAGVMIDGCTVVLPEPPPGWRWMLTRVDHALRAADFWEVSVSFTAVTGR